MNHAATAVMLAAKYRHTEVLRLLHDAGAYMNQIDIRGCDALIYAASNFKTDVLRWLAAGSSTMKSPDFKVGAAFIKAVEIDDHIAVRTLLRIDAFVDEFNDEGFTPLMLAAKSGRADMSQLLLKAGADPNLAMSDGATALMLAAQNGHTAALQALLAAGAKVNLHTKAGSTALELAEKCGHTAAADILRKAGAKTGFFWLPFS